MKQDQVMKVLGGLALVVGLILLVAPVGKTYPSGMSQACGSVLSPEQDDRGDTECSDEISNRLVLSLIVAAVGAGSLIIGAMAKTDESDSKDQPGHKPEPKSRPPTKTKSQPKAARPPDGLIAELERLKRLTDDGFLTKEEAEQAKRQLLGGRQEIVETKIEHEGDPSSTTGLDPKLSEPDSRSGRLRSKHDGRT